MALDWIDKYLQLNKSRKVLKPYVSKKGIEKFKYKVKKRRRTNYSPEEIIEYVKSHNIRKAKELNQAYYDDKNAPPLSQVYKYFDKWNNLIEKVYGIKNNYTDEEIIKILNQFNINKRKQYVVFKQKIMKDLPSPYILHKKLGSWRQIRRMIMAFKYESIFVRLVLLYQKLNKFPNKQQCYENGIEINRLLKVIPKNELIMYMKYLNKN